MNPYREALDLMRIHQQRSMFIERAYATDLSLIEAYVLIEADLNPKVAVVQLCSILMLDHGTIARALLRLTKEKYLRSAPDPDDGRKRLLSVAAKGKAFLARHDRQSREFMATYLTKLSVDEIAELQRYQHRISDAAGAPPVVLRKEEHPFEEGIRRITRGLGFISSSLYGSGHSSTEWQLLAAIAERDSEQATLTALAADFNFRPSSLSQILSRYEKARWLVRSAGAGDARRRALKLTAAGLRVLEQIYRSGEEILQRAFAAESPDAPERFARVLGKHLGILSTDASAVLRPAVEIEEIQGEESLLRARGFVILSLVRNGLYLDAPELIVGKSRRNFALREGPRHLAVAEVAVSREAPELVNLSWDESAQRDLVIQFLERVAMQVCAAGMAVQLVVTGKLQARLKAQLFDQAHEFERRLGFLRVKPVKTGEVG